MERSETLTRKELEAIAARADAAQHDEWGFGPIGHVEGRYLVSLPGDIHGGPVAFALRVGDDVPRLLGHIAASEADAARRRARDAQADIIARAVESATARIAELEAQLAEVTAERDAARERVREIEREARE